MACEKNIFLSRKDQYFHVRAYDEKMHWNSDLMFVDPCIIAQFIKKNLKIYDMIYSLTAIGLSPGGSTHLHTNNT